MLKKIYVFIKEQRIHYSFLPSVIRIKLRILWNSEVCLVTEAKRAYKLNPFNTKISSITHNLPRFFNVSSNIPQLISFFTFITCLVISVFIM